MVYNRFNRTVLRSVKMPPGHISVNGIPMYIKRVLMEPGKMSKVKTFFECLFIFKWNQKFLIIIRFCWNGTRCIQIRLLTARVFCGFLTNILIVQPVLSCINRFICIFYISPVVSSKNECQTHTWRSRDDLFDIKVSDYSII